MQWPSDLLEAIPLGAVIGDKVRDELAALRLERLLPSLDANPEPYAGQCAEALRTTITWLRDGASERARSAARSAAESAARSAESAAESAAWSAAWSAARSAAWSAAWSAESAAWSAESAAESAESAAWGWEADTLLALLRELPHD